MDMRKVIDDCGRIAASKGIKLELPHRLTRDHFDNNEVLDEEALLDELADEVIQIFSYVGGNDLRHVFLQRLIRKMSINSQQSKKEERDA